MYWLWQSDLKELVNMSFAFFVFGEMRYVQDDFVGGTNKQASPG